MIPLLSPAVSLKKLRSQTQRGKLALMEVEISINSPPSASPVVKATNLNNQQSTCDAIQQVGAPSHSTQKRIRWSRKLSSAQMKALIKAYSKNPYPSTEEKEMMCKSFNISMKYIKDWFKGNRFHDRKAGVLVIPASDPRMKCGVRTFTDEQRKIMAEEYARNPYPSLIERQAMSDQFNVPLINISRWFNIRRQSDRQKGKMVINKGAPLSHSEMGLNCTLASSSGDETDVQVDKLMMSVSDNVGFTHLNLRQRQVLLKKYFQNPYPSVDERQTMSMNLKVPLFRINNWFRARRQYDIFNGKLNPRPVGRPKMTGNCAETPAVPNEMEVDQLDPLDLSTKSLTTQTDPIHTMEEDDSSESSLIIDSSYDEDSAGSGTEVHKLSQPSSASECNSSDSMVIEKREPPANCDADSPARENHCDSNSSEGTLSALEADETAEDVMMEAPPSASISATITRVNFAHLPSAASTPKTANRLKSMPSLEKIVIATNKMATDQFPDGSVWTQTMAVRTGMSTKNPGPPVPNWNGRCFTQPQCPPSGVMYHYPSICNQNAWFQPQMPFYNQTYMRQQQPFVPYYRYAPFPMNGGQICYQQYGNHFYPPGGSQFYFAFNHR